MILNFKHKLICYLAIGILTIISKRTSAQVYQYNFIENTDFEVNPAYFGIKNNKPEFLGNVSEFGNNVYRIQTFRAGFTSNFKNMNWGMMFNPIYFPEKVFVGNVSIGTGYNLKLNPKLNLALGLSYKFLNNNLSLGYFDYLRQDAIGGTGIFSDGLNGSFILNDSAKNIIFSMMALNLRAFSSKQVFPTYIVLNTGNIWNLINKETSFHLQLENYLKFSRLENETKLSSILHLKKILNPKSKYKISLGSSIGKLDEKYNLLGIFLGFKNPALDEISLRYNFSKSKNDMIYFEGFNICFKSIFPSKPEKPKIIKGKALKNNVL